ncbi:MAG TPA: efflux transporter outer membrane subunit [Sphingobium sp.]
MQKHKFAGATLAAGLAALLAGCSMAPAYHPPQVVAPAAYKELPGWTAAQPMDDAPRGEWWKAFKDPVLDDLETRMANASPTLEAALARYDQARAAAREATSDLFPTVSVGGDAVRERLSARRPQGNGNALKYNDFTVGAALDYELDLWGRIRNGMSAARAEAKASGSDLESARLNLQVAVADAYFRLRGLDAESELLHRTVDAFGRAYDLTDKRHTGGIASGIDVNRARTQLSGAKAQISQVANQRAATEHELAALVGEVASSFSVAPALTPLDPPPVMGSAPSQLLQRRPDIAAAERRVFAANARIGVARAAIFPSITLGGGAGFEAAHGELLSSPSSFWALGPLSAAMAIFDGGARAARVKISRAEYEEAAASYRGSVLSAFRQVEDGLAANSYLTTQITDQSDAAGAADRTRDLALVRYRDGASDYLEVVLAQTAALDAERATLALRTQHMRSTVALIGAVGGQF